METLTKLRQELVAKSSMIGDLQNNVESLHSNVEVLNKEVTDHKEEAERLRSENSEKLRYTHISLYPSFNQYISAYIRGLFGNSCLLYTSRCV